MHHPHAKQNLRAELSLVSLSLSPSFSIRKHCFIEDTSHAFINLGSSVFRV